MSFFPNPPDWAKLTGEAITRLHNYHRWAWINGKLTAAPNTFDASGSTDNYYLQGVLSLGSVYWGIGIFFFLAFLLAGFIGCCKCGRQARAAAKGKIVLLNRGGCCSKLFSAKVWYILSAVVLIGLSGAGIAMLRYFRNSINDVVGDIQTLQTSFNSSTANYYNASSNLNALTTSLNTLYNNAPIGGNDRGTIQSMLTTVNKLNASLPVASSQLYNIHEAIGDKFLGVDVKVPGVGKSKGYDITSVGQAVFVGGTVVLSLFIAWLVFSMIPAFMSQKPNNKCCRGLDYLCTGLTFVIFLGVYLYAGFYMSVSLVGADVCVAPVDAFINVATEAELTNSEVNTLQFYMTCGSPNASPALPGSIPAVASGFSTDANTLMTQIASVSNSITGWAACNSQILAVTATTSAVYTAIGSCLPLYGVFTKGVNTLCTDGVQFLISNWGLATAACIFIMFLTISALRLLYSAAAEASMEDHQRKIEAQAAVSYNQAQGSVAIPVQQPPVVAGYGTNVGGPQQGSAAQYAQQWK